MGRSRGVVLDGRVALERRREQGLTQSEVADLAGLTTRSYQNAERSVAISAASARAIALALACPVSDLLRSDPERLRRNLAAAGHAPLPPPSPWASRPADVRAVRAALEGPAERIVCCLSGPSGIGKTGLARHVCDTVAPGGHEGIVWVSMSRGRSPIGAVPTMQRIGEVLGQRTRLPDPRSVEAEAFHFAFRTMFWGRRRLLVLDDVELPEEAEPFLGATGRAWALVTTAHRSVADALGEPVVEVGPLSAGAATELLAAHIGAERIHRDPGASRRLVNALGGVPRAIQIAGRILRRERYTTLDHHARQLEAPAAEAADDGRPESVSPFGEQDALFARAYAQLRARLGEERWRLLGLLSVFEDRPFSRRWAEAVATDRPDEGLAELVDLYLLQEVEPAAGEAPGTGDVPAPRFVLDTQALRVAKAIGAANGLDTRRRVLEFARREAVRLAEMEPGRAAAAFSRDFDAWSSCLDGAARRVFGMAAVRPATGPGTGVPEVPADVAEEVASLPRLLAALTPVFSVCYLPELGGWLTAGLAVARRRGDGAGETRVLHLLGNWWCLGAGRFATGSEFAGAAVERARELGRPTEVDRCLHYLGMATYGARGHGATARVLAESVDFARQAGLPRRLTGAALHSSAVTRAIGAGTPEEWQRAKADFREALRLLRNARPPLRLLHDAALVSLAVMRRREGSRVRADGLAKALSDLAEVAAGEDIDVLRLQWLGGYLGASRGRPKGRQAWSRRLHEAIVAAPAGNVPRRIMKLLELPTVLAPDPMLEPARPNAGCPGDVCATGLALGTPTEVRLGRLLLVLYPADFIREVVDARAVDLGLSFAERTCVPGHPLTVLLGRVKDATSG